MDHRHHLAGQRLRVGLGRQLAGCVAALDLRVAPEHGAALDAIGAPTDPRMLSTHAPVRRQVAFGGASVAAWPTGG